MIRLIVKDVFQFSEVMSNSDTNPADTPGEPPFVALKVADKQALTRDITLFELRHPDGLDLPAFTAGSHVTVQVPNGMRRNYSICSCPAERGFYQIAVKRDERGGGGSISMVDGVQVSDLLPTSVPRNNFELTQRANDFLFIAGGIGITPILSMMRHLKANDQARFKLYYCTRDAESTAFLEELNRSEFAGRITIHHDHGDLGQAFDFWNILEKPTKAHVYCCGPGGLMNAVRDASGHWPSSTIHFESFGVVRTQAKNQPFTVRLQKSGEIIPIAKDQSILDALRAHGHRVPSSCESGTCGSCRTGLVAGEADHRDMVLNDSEKETQIMVCVSRAKSVELVLDL